MSDYTAKQGTTALGVIGTALGGLATVGGLSGIFGSSSGDYFTKNEATLMYENTAKDAQIALLKANSQTDTKLADVYQAAANRDKQIRSEIYTEFNNIRSEMQTMQNNQNAINSAQAVDNATTASALAVLGTNQQNLQNIISGLTKTVIPNSNVCPGWGQVTIYPSGGTTVGTTIA